MFVCFVLSLASQCLASGVGVKEAYGVLFTQHILFSSHAHLLWFQKHSEGVGHIALWETAYLGCVMCIGFDS